MKPFVLVALVVGVLSAQGAQQQVRALDSSQTWLLIWNDEFNDPDGTPPDPAKWEMERGGTGWGNDELEYYTARHNNIRQENGNLVIEAFREKFIGPDGVERNERYTFNNIGIGGLSSTVPTTAFLNGDFSALLDKSVVKGWPPIWQRWWFPLVCVTVAAVVSLGLYSVLAFQATRRLQRRFEERLAERTRVAQELHDTLLQGILSASMQLHVAVDQLPSDSPARPALNRILTLMSQVIDEGRNTVRGLRFPSESPNDLEHSLVRVQQELGFGEQVDFRVIVQGSPLPLNEAIRDDVYSIGREALVNAFRHSRAENIAVELEYAMEQMWLRVRDDGQGIDPHLLATGRDGHFGMTGMRERADRIGAQLKVYSRVAGGTEVELFIPGHIAFESSYKSHTSKWLSRIYPWKTKAGFPHHAGPGAAP